MILFILNVNLGKIGESNIKQKNPLLKLKTEALSPPSDSSLSLYTHTHAHAQKLKLIHSRTVPFPCLIRIGAHLFSVCQSPLWCCWYLSDKWHHTQAASQMLHTHYRIIYCTRRCETECWWKWWGEWPRDELMKSWSCLWNTQKLLIFYRLRGYRGHMLVFKHPHSSSPADGPNSFCSLPSTLYTTFLSQLCLSSVFKLGKFLL